MPLHLPYTKDNFDSVVRVVRQVKGIEIIGPDNATEPIATAILGCWHNEQRWLDEQVVLNPKQPQILYGVFEPSRGINAFAIETTDEAAGFIGVGFDLIFHLNIFFNSAMCHPEVLADLGNSKLEVWPRPSTRPLDLQPRCPIRGVYCQNLMMMAQRFLTAHEFIHIVHGHLRLRLQKSSSYSLSEAAGKLPLDQALLQQTLEMDADAGAVVECLATRYPVSYNNPGVNGGSPIVIVGQPPAYSPAYLRLWFFAIHSLFRVLSSLPRRLPLEQSSHPDPMTRLVMIWNVFFSLHQNFMSLKLMTLVDTAFQQSLHDGESAYNLLVRTGQQSEPDNIFEAFARKTYFALLKEEWKAIRPALEPLNRSRRSLAPALSWNDKQ